MGERRDGGFCHKHADLRTVTEYPGGEVQAGTWKYRCKIQGEISRMRVKRYVEESEAKTADEINKRIITQSRRQRPPPWEIVRQGKKRQDDKWKKLPRKEISTRWMQCVRKTRKQFQEGMGLNYLRMSRGTWVKNSTLRKVCFPWAVMFKAKCYTLLGLSTYTSSIRNHRALIREIMSSLTHRRHSEQ